MTKKPDTAEAGGWRKDALKHLEQGAVTVCLIMLAGWAVYPRGGRRSA